MENIDLDQLAQQLMTVVSTYGLRVIACNAQGADFSNADVSMAIGREGGLCDATFERTNLAYADLSAMDLSRCRLTGCAIETNCVRAKRALRLPRTAERSAVVRARTDHDERTTH